MAHSSVTYKEKLVFFREPGLELATEELCKVFDAYAQTYFWLSEASDEWRSDLEIYPPGLRNICLDKWLTSDARISIFLEMVEKAWANQTNLKMAYRIENFRDIVTMEQIDPLRKDKQIFDISF